MPRPKRALKAFAKVSPSPWETRRLSFDLPPADIRATASMSLPGKRWQLSMSTRCNIIADAA